VKTYQEDYQQKKGQKKQAVFKGKKQEDWSNVKKGMDKGVKREVPEKEKELGPTVIKEHDEQSEDSLTQKSGYEPKKSNPKKKKNRKKLNNQEKMNDFLKNLISNEEKPKQNVQKSSQSTISVNEGDQRTQNGNKGGNKQGNQWKEEFKNRGEVDKAYQGVRSSYHNKNKNTLKHNSQQCPPFEQSDPKLTQKHNSYK